MVENEAPTETYIKLKTEQVEDNFEITDLTDEVRYFELFQSIREKNPNQQNKKIVLFKLTGLPDGEDPKGIYEDEKQLDELLFVDEEIREIEGKPVKYLEFEIYFLEKKTLRVFFFVEINQQNNMYCESIQKFLLRFQSLYFYY